jgi:hypothetical protein
MSQWHSSVQGADVVTTGGPGGRFTLSGQTVVDAAANGDGAAAELKSQTIQSLAELIVPNLGKNPPPELPVGTTTTNPPGPVGKKPSPSPETTITSWSRLGGEMYAAVVEDCGELKLAAELGDDCAEQVEGQADFAGFDL